MRAIYLGQTKLYQESEHITSYEQAKAHLQGKQVRKVNSTGSIRFQMESQSISLFLYNTCIMSFDEIGIQYWTDGYRTVTTKEVLNQYSPVFIHTEKGIWYVGKTWGDKRSLFYEGMIIRYDGTIVAPRDPKAVEKETKKLKAAIKRYCNAVIETLPDMDMPSEGDCWDCCMVEANTNNYIDDLNKNSHHYLLHMGLDHEQHPDELYVVPTLVFRAMKEKGYTDTGVLLSLGYDNKTGKFGNRWMSESNIRRALTDFLWKRLAMTVLQ